VVLQELYEAVPVALAPVLGNPLSLAAAGIDRSAPLQTQARLMITSQIKLPASNVQSIVMFVQSGCWWRGVAAVVKYERQRPVVVVQAAAFAQGLTNLIPQLTALTNILPPATLAWKLRLLAAGCKFVENKCARHKILQPVSPSEPNTCCIQHH